MRGRKAHWENVYTSKSPLDVSWYQREPERSLQLIHNARTAIDAPVIDVGGGASLLVDRLLDRGFSRVSVLDVSVRALGHAKTRLGSKADKVEWIESDVTRFQPTHRYSLWHDRAVFHFLTDADDRSRYRQALNDALEPGGHFIIMAFSPDGPEKCSGLNIVQYDANKIMSEFGECYELLETGNEDHQTPGGKLQAFSYFSFCKKN